MGGAAFGGVVTVERDQVGNTPNRLETRISIGFQADTPLFNRTLLISDQPITAFQSFNVRTAVVSNISSIVSGS